jgi:hypothetical protein
VKDSIFISYRIADTGDVTGRIYDYLVQHFGKDRVFKDVQGIGLGLDFRKEIEKALNNCGVMLAVIGPTWLTVTDKEGNRRLDNPGDWVRFEIETALSKEIPLIPLRVKGASLPMESELPESIKELAYRNATEIKLNDPDFGKDMGWLVEGIQKIIGGVDTSKQIDAKKQKDSSTQLTSNEPKMPNSKTNLLGYLKTLSPPQFNELVFLLEEGKLIDKSYLSYPVAPTTSAIEVINLLKQRSDGISQLESLLKDTFNYSS